MDNNNYDYILDLQNGMIKHINHSVFYLHMRNCKRAFDDKLRPFDYVIRAVGSFDDWRFQTFLVLNSDNENAYLKKAHKYDCPVEGFDNIYAEDLLYFDVCKYLQDLSKLPLEVKYTQPAPSVSDPIYMPINLYTVLFEAGKARKVISEQIMHEAVGVHEYSRQFSCILKEGLIFAKKESFQTHYYVVHSLHRISGQYSLRALCEDDLGEDIVNSIKQAFKEQEEYILENIDSPLIING